MPSAGRVPSRARPHKGAAKALHARHRAALTTGGGRLPAGVRRHLEPLEARTKPARGGPRGPAAGSTRAGKRVPRRAKRAKGR